MPPPLRSLDVPARIRARERLEASNRYRRWGRDPIAFVWDAFEWGDGKGPTWYQEEILWFLVERGRAAERGPHGVGKTALAALVVLWFRFTSDDLEQFPSWMAVTTAGGHRQLREFLWPEIHKWVRKLRWDKVGMDPFTEGDDLLDLSLKGRTGSAIAVASANPELIEGAHAERLLYVYDEAAAIAPGIWDAAEGAFSGAGDDTGAEAFALAVGKPTVPAGRFYDIHSRRRGHEGWWVRHVTADEAVRAGRMSAQWLAEKERQWGRTSSVFRRRALGEFAGDDERTVIPLDWIEAAIERWHERTSTVARRNVGPLGSVPVLLTAVGVDVAEGGGDQTVLAPRAGDFVDALIRPGIGTTMETAGQTAMVIGTTRAQAVVDVLGVGAGVGSRLRELSHRVGSYKGSEATTRKDRTSEFGFANTRTAAYWAVREALDPALGPTLALPDDDELIGDLTTPRYEYTSQALIALEPKKDLIRRLGRSPDAGDAVVMALWEELGGPPGTNIEALRTHRLPQ